MNKDLKIFFKDNVYSVLLICIFTVIIYGFKFFSLDFSIDNENCIVDPERIYNAWLGMGRFGLVGIKCFLGSLTYNPYLWSALTIFLLVLDCLFFIFIFFKLSETQISKFSLIIFSLLFLSSPIIAEQLGFVMQAPEVLIGVFFVSLAGFCLIMFCNKSLLFRFILPVLLLFCGFSIYQSLIPLYTSIIASQFFIWIYYNNKRENKFLIKLVLYILATFVIAIVGFVFLKKIILHMFGISQVDYTLNQILWGTIPFIDSIRMIIKNIICQLTCQKIFYTILIPLSVVSFALFLIIYLLRHKKNIFWYLITGAYIIISPFLMNIILGGYAPARTMLSSPYICSFMIMFVAAFVIQRFQGKKIYKMVVTTLAAIVVFNQLLVTTRIYYTEYITNVEQYNMATVIGNKINELTGNTNSNVPVVFIGTHELNRNHSCYNAAQLELVGISFFEVSFNTYHGSFIKNNYLQCYGYKFITPTEEYIFREAEIEATEMLSWPNQDCIRIKHDYVIVKL